MNQIKQHEEKIGDDTSNKRKWEGDHKGSSSQQQSKKPKVIRAHTAGLSNKKGYVGNLPLTLILRAKQSLLVAKQKAEVTCYECGMLGHYKSKCPMNETLIVRGDGSDQGNETRLNIISCTKTQKYMLKGCHVFLAHVTTKKAKDKSEEKKRFEIIDLIPGAALVAQAPYLLALSEIKKLADQLQELSNNGFIRPSSSPWGKLYFVMSDLKDSMVTYIEVSSPFEDLSDIGSPGVDGLAMMLEDPSSYVVAAFQTPSSPNYVPGPEEPE
ncbi:putative reverse transcriptase domain-containing protein [Tanacetum coccineum]